MRDSKGRQSCRPAFGVSGHRWSTYMEGLASMGAFGARGGIWPPPILQIKCARSYASCRARILRINARRRTMYMRSIGSACPRQPLAKIAPNRDDTT